MSGLDLLLDRSARPVLGHRGASGLLPENTLAAFDLARRLGVDGLEFDVHLSADGVPVVHHDRTLDRTTNLRGPVRAQTARALGRADAGGGERVPTVAEALEATGDLPLLIELKVAEAALPLLQVIRAAGAGGRVMVASFLRAAVEPLRDSGLALGASRPEILAAAAGALFGWRPGRVPFQAYAVPTRWRGLFPVPTRRFVQRAARQGCPVHVWTVDDPREARALWGRGVAGILTNRPDLILAERHALRSSAAA